MAKSVLPGFRRTAWGVRAVPSSNEQRDDHLVK